MSDAPNEGRTVAPPAPIPPPFSVFTSVQRFDLAIDSLFDHLRGRPVPDRIFEIASHLGDWGLIWNMQAVALGLRSDEDAHRAPRLVAGFAAESLIVNQGIKRLFRRSRPTDLPDVAARLRVPLTTSFPSGHASSAAFASVVLCHNNPGLRPVVIPIALVVATSRIHTRMHHPSDVLAGAGIGWLLGRAALALPLGVSRRLLGG